MGAETFRRRGHVVSRPAQPTGSDYSGVCAAEARAQAILLRLLAESLEAGGRPLEPHESGMILDAVRARGRYEY